MASKKKQAATSLPPELGEFDGRPVRSTGIRITNAGDGLSKALAVDPKVMYHRDQVYVVLETEVTNVAFPPFNTDDDGVIRLHTLKAGRATIVDAELVSDVLEAQQRRLDEAAGKLSLPFAADERTDEEIIGTPDEN